MARLTIEPINATFDRIRFDEPALAFEFSDFFTFDVPGAQHSPKFKMGVWDGKIRLYKNGRLYRGLRNQVWEWARVNEVEVDVSALPVPGWKPIHLTSFWSELEIPPYIEEKEHQLQAIEHCSNHRRCLLISPTSSGKSFILYVLHKWFGKKTLICVPRKSLVRQLVDEFVGYGGNPDDYHQVMGGVEKWTDRPVTVSTWHSAWDQPPEWKDQFEVVFGDEAHLFNAKSLVYLMEGLRNAHVRIGCTGTLHDSKVNQLVLEGLFGPIQQFVTTRELQESGDVSKLKIKVIVLKHPEKIRKGWKKVLGEVTYQKEIEYLVANQARNRFLGRLSTRIKGNTILLFDRVEKHGIPLYQTIQDMAPERKAFLIHGGVDVNDRVEIKKILERESDATLAASLGTFSTGENVKNLHNIVLGHPMKSKVTLLQSIGRGLRLHESKDVCTLYDVADDLSWKSRKNYTLKHLEERLKVYAREKFDYEIHRVDLTY